MGVLKLSVIEDQLRERKSKLRPLKKGEPLHVGNCDCPYWAFVRKGDVVAYEDDDVASTASWNID